MSFPASTRFQKFSRPFWSYTVRLLCFTFFFLATTADQPSFALGTDDEVIDFSHGISIYEKCPKAVEPLWVEGAGHNDVELYNQYLDRLKKFLSVELVNWQSKNLPGQTKSPKHVADGDAGGKKTLHIQIVRKHFKCLVAAMLFPHQLSINFLD